MSTSSSQLGGRPSWLRLSATHHLKLLVPFLGATLFLRILTDNLSSPDSRQSGSLNLSGVIAVLFILVAIALLLRRREGLRPTILIAVWLGIWTAIAINTSGASTETLREGVREASIVALAVIVYNGRGAVTVPIATRLIQLIGAIPALLALYQLASHTGMDVAGHLRSNGTFAHPNSAVVFFAIATTTSLWRYLDYGRHRSDAAFVLLFAAAALSTYSIDGMITLLAMTSTLGALHHGDVRTKIIPVAVGALVIVVFFATPLGSQRVEHESATSLAAAERGEGKSSLTWRIKKWKSLIPEWESSPLVGRGLGTTTTAESTPADPFAGFPPHNEYVRYLVETGVVGFALLLLALALMVRRLALLRRIPAMLAAGNLDAPTLAIAIVVGCLVNALADNTFLDTPTSYASALIVFAALSASRVALGRTPAPQAV